MSVIKTRFAPSPTGYIHVGNVRTALVNWLFTRKMGGEFVLRLDDTDQERSKAEYEAAIVEDMTWLGLIWDNSFNQSSRYDRYAEATEQLKQMGRLYPCYETPEELEVQRKMLASRGLPPIYNRAALKLTEEQKQTYEAEGRKPHWRFLLNDNEIVWDDLIRGEVHFKATHMSDPVLIRADGIPLYTMASVVDDGDTGVTHVIRGEDHVSNTAVQMQIYEAFGFKAPEFAHMALLKTKEGELSKRVGGNDIRAMREAGIMPMAINSLLAKIGTSDAIEAVADLEALINSFDFSKFSRSPANYDAPELEKLNEKLLHQLPFESVQHLVPFANETFWNSVRGNLKNIHEAKEWWAILHESIDANLDADEKTFVQSTAALLPSSPWDDNTWNTWITAIKPTTERKGKALFMPLRKALTGMEHGPELKVILPLIGEEKVRQRLVP